VRESSTEEIAPGGDTHSTRVEDTNLAGTALEPNTHSREESLKKFAPATDTRVPPPLTPEEGATEKIWARLWYSNEEAVERESPALLETRRWEIVPGIWKGTSHSTLVGEL
jgi:hypothetical protein